MEHNEKTIELIVEKNSEGFEEWIFKQPLILRPDIMKEFAAICTEIAKEKGIDLDEVDLDDYAKGIYKYEEVIKKQQVAAVNLYIAKLSFAEGMRDIEEARKDIKEYVKECVETNANNAASIKQLAKQIIELEKKAGIYNAEDWSWFTY